MTNSGPEMINIGALMTGKVNLFCNVFGIDILVLYKIFDVINKQCVTPENPHNAL
jgi:hypothetical protein